MAEHTKKWFFVNGSEEETPGARRNGGGAEPDTITKLIYPDGTVLMGQKVCTSSEIAANGAAATQAPALDGFFVVYSAIRAGGPLRTQAVFLVTVVVDCLCSLTILIAGPRDLPTALLAGLTIPLNIYGATFKRFDANTMATGAAFGCIGRIHPVTSYCGGAQVVTALIHATHAANVARMFASIALVAAAACIRASMVRRNIHDCVWPADCGEWTAPSNTLPATTNSLALLLLSCRRGYRVDTSSLHLLRNCSTY